MMRVRLSWLAIWCAAVVLIAGAHAQSPERVNVDTHAFATAGEPEIPDVPEEIARQRQALFAQREAILKSDAQQQVLCWQKFAVNACLIETRRLRRQALDPLAQQELLVNAQERAWRSVQREQRLLGKQPALQVAP